MPSEPEESHWRTVELRRDLAQGAELRGASASMPHASATTTTLPRQEELMIGLSLPSESEHSSFKSQNDTDSEMSGAPHPHLRVVGSTPWASVPSPGAVPSSGVGGRADSHPPPMPTSTTTTRSPATSPLAQQRLNKAAFVQEDSFYLPSSAQSESESLEEDEAPPLPSSAPPGMSVSALQPRPQAASAVTTPVAKKTFVSAMTVPKLGQGSAGVEGTGGREGGSQKGLQTTSVVGLSIRQRIAQIERQLKVCTKA